MSENIRSNLSAKAGAIAELLAATARERDKSGGTAKLERDALRWSGLLNLLVEKQHGGEDTPWPMVLDIVRQFARVDSSVAHLFGFQHLIVATIRLFGNPDQVARYSKGTVDNRWFWGNALNPLDRRTTARFADGHWVVNGLKNFCSGARDSDQLLFSAFEESTGRLIVAAIPSNRDGITINDDWDNMGQRQTDSGSVVFENVQVGADEVLGPPGPLGNTYATLRPCIAQLLLANIFLGIGEGALEEARRYTGAKSRPWFSAGVDKATDDPYILHHFGNLSVELSAARHVADAAARELQGAWEQGNDLAPEARGKLAVSIATAKILATCAGLDTASRIFDVMGASATAARFGYDRFWRNARTHTLHDPVDYKIREVGDWVLNQRIPSPSFYS